MADNTQESNKSHRRGKLKIFLGAVAGVGKTYAMLAEAHRRKNRGEDIVIGIVVTHGRKETQKLTEGLEQVPLKHIEYRGQVFEEMDTDAVIKRHPQTVLVDELAHTNIPGTKHAKRWQSVNDILDAGIDVLSTLNVQHLESFNDTVMEITGVRVRETIPDSFLDVADELILVDLTPGTLINRLKRGDIYAPDKVNQALENFFKVENISALRELALRLTADEVDERLRNYLKEQEEARATTPAERVAVFIKPEQKSIKIIRRAYRFARRLAARFWVVSIRYPGARLTSKEESIIEDFKDLARNLGGEFVQRENDNITDEIIDFAKQQRLTFIVLGPSARSRFQEIYRSSIISSLMRRSINVDILIVSPQENG